LDELKGLSQGSVVTAGADVVACDLIGASALLNMRSSTYYTLNQVGSRIWSLIQQPTSVSAICDDVVAHYEVDRTRCYDDVVTLLRDLNDAGLIEIVD
jgi:hypothetical protein